MALPLAHAANLGKDDYKAGKQMAGARQDANRDKMEADYKVAAEKCDALAGDAKTACVKSAKARYKQ